MKKQQLKNILEAALFAVGRPMDLNEILRLFSEEDRPNRKAMRELIDELGADYAGRAVELREVASGFRIQVRAEYGEWLGKLSEERAPRYSRALLETLALIAYRQPVTRGEIENVRGVSVSSNIVRTLLERGWVRIVGHRDVPGRPAMLGTTKEFLDYFNLKSLDELPSLAELKDFESINVELDFDAPLSDAAPATDGAPGAGDEAGDADMDDGDDSDADTETRIDEVGDDDAVRDADQPDRAGAAEAAADGVDNDIHDDVDDSDDEDDDLYDNDDQDDDQDTDEDDDDEQSVAALEQMTPGGG